MTITEKQAHILQIEPRTQISNLLEKCCLSLSANVSYESAARDIKLLTGVMVPHSTQQRLVQRYEFEAASATQIVTEMSLDGGKVRLRTPLGEECCWRDYKAINLHGQAVAAFFAENESLSNWANAQPLETVVSCLGDGHDGIWNIFGQINCQESRFEILDWYHLVENLHQVECSPIQLEQIETLLWRGDVDGAIEELAGSEAERAAVFVKHLVKHQARIVNYEYLQMEGFSIGSGAVESTIKQLSRRVKISGAQWNRESVPQLLKHRCAYLNGDLTDLQ